MESMSCDEPTVFRSRCGAKLARWAALRRAWRHKRGLAITWRPSKRRQPGGMPANLHGAGLLLGAVYRLHALCMRVRRYCYISLYDTNFERYFGYADNGTSSEQLHMSWAPRADELAKYASVARVTLPCTRRCKKGAFIEENLTSIVQSASLSSMALIAITIEGWIPLYQVDRNASEVLTGAPVDPCLSRAVTEPLDVRRHTRLRDTRAAEMALHMRTGFADAADTMITSVAPDNRTADDWLRAACGSDPFGARADRSLTVLSDSAGLLRSLERRYPTKVLMRPGAVPRNQSSRSWWTSNLEQQFETLDDIVVAGLSRVLVVAPQLQIIGGHVYGATIWSSFFWPAARRSVCLSEVRFGLPECASFGRVFLRDLPQWLDLKLPWSIDSVNARDDRFVSNISALEARRPLRYEALRTHGFRDTARRSGAHPCRHVRQAALCYKMFVAALK